MLNTTIKRIRRILFPRDYVMRNIRSLMHHAVKTKSDFDKGFAAHLIMPNFDKYLEYYLLLKPYIEKYGGTGRLIQHTHWLTYHLKLNNTRDCYRDISDICEFDILQFQESYICKKAEEMLNRKNNIFYKIIPKKVRL